MKYEAKAIKLFELTRGLNVFVEPVSCVIHIRRVVVSK